MSKVIRISEELYEQIENVAFENGVQILHLTDELIKAGIKKCKKDDDLFVENRGRTIKIKL